MKITISAAFCVVIELKKINLSQKSLADSPGAGGGGPNIRIKCILGSRIDVETEI